MGLFSSILGWSKNNEFIFDFRLFPGFFGTVSITKEFPSVTYF